MPKPAVRCRFNADWRIPAPVQPSRFCLMSFAGGIRGLSSRPRCETRHRVCPRGACLRARASLGLASQAHDIEGLTIVDIRCSGVGFVLLAPQRARASSSFPAAKSLGWGWAGQQAYNCRRRAAGQTGCRVVRKRAGAGAAAPANQFIRLLNPSPMRPLSTPARTYRPHRGRSDPMLSP